MKTYLCKKPKIRKAKNGKPLLLADITKGKSIEVSFPVSCTYNGGITISGEWYDGYDVPNPDVPEGWEIVSIGVGLQLNARPPYCTRLLCKKASNH